MPSRPRGFYPCWQSCCACAGRVRAAAADRLVWHKQPDRMDADVQSWNVRQLLEQVASATRLGNLSRSGRGASGFGQIQQSSNERSVAFAAGQRELSAHSADQRHDGALCFPDIARTGDDLVAPVKKPAQPIPNELVVTLKPGSKTKIEELAKSLGAKVIGRMDSRTPTCSNSTIGDATRRARNWHQPGRG